MKLSDIKGDNALDVLADIIDPLVDILNDRKVEEAYKRGDNLGCIKVIIREHKESITTILAIFSGEDPKQYKPGVFTLPIKLAEVLDDPDVTELFSLQGVVTSSGSAMENTEVKKN